jgi:xanthine dehydrogenase YagS FAD-binding subunit
MAYRPWRSVEAERVLIGGLLTEATAEMAAVEALKSAQTNGHNDYKPALARQTLVRALLQASSMTLEGAPVQA